MGDHTGKDIPEGICCFGVSRMGFLMSTILAHMCPNRIVNVVDPNPEKVALWNTHRIPINNPKLKEMLKLSQNKNLIFTTDTESSIRDSKFIFISLDPITADGENKSKKIFDLSEMESAIRFIAKVSESEKIILLKTTVPVGTTAALKGILDINKTNSDFLIYSFPEFDSLIDPGSSYLKPSKILLGCDRTPKSRQGVEKVRPLFNRDSPPQIIKISSRSAELGKICSSAFVAQKIANTNALSIIAEELGSDSSAVFCKLLPSHFEFYLDVGGPILGFGNSHLKKHLMYLIEFCETLNLYESADYWRQVMIMNEFQEKRFLKKILSAFFCSLSHKKLAIWGLECNKTCQSLATDLCKNFVAEGAKLNVCEPERDAKQLMCELKAAGLEEGKDVICFEDPYKAAHKTDAIIVLSNVEGVESLDFQKIYQDMEKPAYIFDSMSCLPYEKLIEIGFHVEAIGKKTHQPQIFDYIH